MRPGFESPKPLAERPPRPSPILARSCPPKRARAAESPCDAAPKRTIRPDHRGDPPTPGALGHVLASPALTARCPRHSPFPSRLPRETLRRASVGLPPAPLVLDPHRVRRERPPRLLGRALDFRALLRVWVGTDSVPLPTRLRPVLPWVSDSPPRYAESLASRSSWRTSFARAAKCGVLDAGTDSPTDGRHCAWPPSRDIPLAFAFLCPSLPGETPSSHTPTEMGACAQSWLESIRRLTGSVRPRLRGERFRGQSRPSWGS